VGHTRSAWEVNGAVRPSAPGTILSSSLNCLGISGIYAGEDVNKHANTMASICYDEAVLSMDELFISFFNNDESNILLIEDADTHIKSRESGNELMKRFLNVADGIYANFGKKIVFTTNLPNIREVDSALIRPGRCFDVLQFRKLEVEELNRLAKKLGIEKKVNTSMTLAEFFSHTNEVRERSNVNSRFGFI
jgi:hypothetical protein